MINKNTFLISRIIFYILIFFIYLFFMKKYSPLGVDWLDWHYQRLINLSQFLDINVYFSNYGFSIWTTNIDCALKIECWKDNLYLSHLIFSKVFYLFIYEFIDPNSFTIYGQIVDKFFIFFTAVLIAEILINYTKNIKSKTQSFFVGILCFTFFIVNPWTYKMLIASWDVIFFLSFFLLGLLLTFKNKKKLGLFIIFLSGFFEYQLSAGIAVYYFILLMFYFFYKDKKILIDFFPFKFNQQNKFLIYNSLMVVVLLFPAFTHFYLKYIFLNNNLFVYPAGSSLLTRIGISGNDLHNGGIVGALQFLAGNRFTVCFENDFQNIIQNFQTENISKISIYIYNCLLSHFGIFIISLISILGLIYVFKNDSLIKKTISPIIFLILCNAFILQQSSSVHLMGYSYLFSVVFSVGLSIFLFNIWNKYKSKLMILFLTPITIGVILLCIRVSMLTGINS